MPISWTLEPMKARAEKRVAPARFPFDARFVRAGLDASRVELS